MNQTRHVGFNEDVPPEKSRPNRPPIAQRRRSIAVPGSFVMPKPKPQAPPPRQEDDVVYEKGIKIKLPLLKTKEEWRAMQEREEHGEKPVDKPVNSPTAFNQEDNVDASVHLRPILANSVPEMKARSKDNAKRAKNFATNLMKKLGQDGAMNAFFRRKQFKGERLYNLCQTGPGAYDLRIYIRAFLFRDEFQITTGFNNNISPGKVAYTLSTSLTTEQRETVRRTWSQIIQKGRLQANILQALLNEALHGLFKHGDLDIATHSLDNDSRVLILLPGQPLTIRLMASIPGQGLPRFTNLVHAMPKHPPYGLRGKEQLVGLHQDLQQGCVLWHADAGADQYWTLSFDQMLAKLTANADSVPRSMTYQECKDLFHLIQVCNPVLNCISPSLLEFNLIRVWKRNFQPAEDIYEETVVLLLRKLSLCLRAGKCPHLFYSSMNIVTTEPEDVVKAAQLLERLARILWIRPDKIAEYTRMKDDRNEKQAE